MKTLEEYLKNKYKETIQLIESKRCISESADEYFGPFHDKPEALKYLQTIKEEFTDAWSWHIQKESDGWYIEGYDHSSWVEESLEKDFYGLDINSEGADDLLFALQVWFGQPKYGFEDFIKMNLSQETLDKASKYVINNELDKFTYFDESLNEAKKKMSKYGHETFPAGNPAANAAAFNHDMGVDTGMGVEAGGGEACCEEFIGEGHQIQTYKGFELDWNEDNIDAENGKADFSIEIIKDGEVIKTIEGGYKAARDYIDNNNLDNTKWVIYIPEGPYAKPAYYNEWYIDVCVHNIDIEEGEADLVFTEDINEAAKFDSKEIAEKYAYDEDAFYQIWAEDENPHECVKVVKESEVSESLNEEVELEETYSDEELDDMVGKVYNLRKITKWKREEDQLWAYTICTKCGREKRVLLSNLVNDPEKYGSCICSDTNVDAKIDNAKELYTGAKVLSSNTSGYTGVSFVKNYRGKPYNKWRAYIEVDGKRTYLGDFNAKKEAVKARKEAGEKGVKWYKDNRNKLMRDVRRKTKKYKNSKYRDSARKTFTIKKDKKKKDK